MLLKIQFLNHYKGSTKNDPSVKERMAWAETEVDIDCVAHGKMELTFLEGRGDREAFDLDRAFSFDGKYWAVVEATNNTSLHRMRRTYMLDERKHGPNGLRNFDTDGQREFSWRAFEYRLMPRQPSKGFRKAEPYNFRNYRPDKIGWDDFDIVATRAAAYYRDNLLIAGDTVYCRIEPPSLGEPVTEYRDIIGEQRLFTPYGGFGDPVIDFQKAYEAALAVDSPEELAHARKERAPFFDVITEYEVDHIRRGVRALFLSLFGLEPWLVAKAKSPKNAEAIEALHVLWQENLPYLSDGVLDEAAEIMLGVAKDESQRSIFQQWLDRPVFL